MEFGGRPEQRRNPNPSAPHLVRFGINKGTNRLYGMFSFRSVFDWGMNE
jgi:hypothetical protein